MCKGVNYRFLGYKVTVTKSHIVIQGNIFSFMTNTPNKTQSILLSHHTSPKQPIHPVFLSPFYNFPYHTL